ncbi:MAG: hypothetical protein QXU67_05155 [Candidatus Bathyarchaeia archaeon]
MSESEVVVKAKISIAEIVVLILIAWGAFSWGFITRALSLTKYWVVTGDFIPYIYLLLLVGYLGKKGIRISKEFFVVLMYVLMLFTAKWYYFSGSSEVNFYNNIAGSFSSAMAGWQFPTWARDYLPNLIPAWLIPQDDYATALYYNGGGDPVWSVFIGPIIAWSLILISIVLVSWPMIFLILGPHWWDVERLQFPLTIPAIYTINETYPAEESEKAGEWLRLLNTKIGRNKAFWIAFAVGLVLNAPYIATQLFPAIPLGGVIGGGYGTYPITLYPLVQDVLPNAQVNTSLVIYNCLLYAIFPLDLSVTIAIVGMFIGLIYRPLVTRAGLIPTGVDPSTTWPFPHGELRIGTYLGLTAVVLWVTRERWSKAFSSLKKDFEVEGVSMRLGMIMMIIGAILMIGIWTAAGGNLFMMIFWFILFTIVNIGGAYYYAAAFWYAADCHGYTSWRLGHSLGAALGVWSATPPQTNRALAIYGFASSSMGTCVGPYESNGVFSQSLATVTYALAKGVRADVRKILYYIIIILIALIPFALVVNTYVNSHVGIANTGETGMDVNWWGVVAAGIDTGNRGLTWSVGYLPLWQQWVTAFIGAVLIIVIGWLRTVFPWFFLHPVGVLRGSGGWIGWPNMIIGISLRVILDRTLGPKRAMEYMIPVIAGIALGLGALYILVGLTVMFTASLPNLAALWK